MCRGLATAINKIIFYGFVIAVWVGAGAFIGIGIYLAVENPTDKYSAIFNDVDVSIWEAAIYLLIPLGVTVAGFGIAGCCGAWRERTFLIWVFCVAMIVLIGGQFAAMVMAGKFKDDVKFNMADTMQQQLVSDYVSETSDDVYSDAWNKIQQDLQCCGSNYYTDYYLYSEYFDKTGNVVPYTCCDGEQDNYDRCLSEAVANETQLLQLYRKGCFSQLYLHVEQQMSMIVATGSIVLAIQIGAIIFGCMLRDTYKHIVK